MMIAQRIQPDVILLDVPGDELEEAVAICRNIKDTDSLRSARVVAAVNGSDHSADRLKAEGFDEVIPRPYTAEAVLEVAGAVAGVTG